MSKNNYQHTDNHIHGNGDSIHSHQHKHDHHGHSHTHSYSHDHHGHDQHKIIEKELGFKEKLLVLFQHWIEHNDSHKDNYISWARKAEDENFSDTAALLMDAAAASDIITEKLENALKTLGK